MYVYVCYSPCVYVFMVGLCSPISNLTMFLNKSKKQGGSMWLSIDALSLQLRRLFQGVYACVCVCVCVYVCVYVYVWMCIVCVCVCVSETNRGRERGRSIACVCILYDSKHIHSYIYILSIFLCNAHTHILSLSLCTYTHIHRWRCILHSSWSCVSLITLREWLPSPTSRSVDAKHVATVCVCVFVLCVCMCVLCAYVCLRLANRLLMICPLP